MAHFYGSMRGSRGEATRMGTAKSGLIAHIRGWNTGVEVVLTVDDEGRDCVAVYVTAGSNGRTRVLLSAWKG